MDSVAIHFSLVVSLLRGYHNSIFQRPPAAALHACTCMGPWSRNCTQGAARRGGAQRVPVVTNGIADAATALPPCCRHGHVEPLCSIF